MILELYSEANPGTFTSGDVVGVECCDSEDMSAGMVTMDNSGHVVADWRGISQGNVILASGGCIVVECSTCGNLWRCFGLPTHGVGPLISASEYPQDIAPLQNGRR